MGLVFTIPLESMIAFPEIGTFSRMIGVLVAVSAFVCILLGKKAIKLNSVQSYALLYLLWSIVTFYWSVDIEKSYKSILTLSRLVVFLFVICQFAQKENEQIGLMKAYVYGSLFSSFSIIYSFINKQEYDFFRYSAYGFDPNDLGLTLALAIPMAWYVSFIDTSKIMSWVYRLIVPLLVFGITLTASRGAFVALLVALSFILWSLYRLPVKFKLLFMAFVLTTTLLIIKFAPVYSWERILSIGSELHTGSLSGRFTIWREGLNAFFHNPIFGVGVGGFKSGVESTLGRQAAPHNLFLGILVGQGIVGFFIFGAMLLAIITRIRNMPPLNRQLWIVMLATWCAGVMSLGWEFRKPTWFLIGLAAVQCSLAVKGSKTDSSPDPSSETLVTNRNTVRL
jgi:O-antigen ligase